MKTLMIASTLALASFGLGAQEATGWFGDDRDSMKSRDQVRSEAIAAIDDGEVFYGEAMPLQDLDGRSRLSREAVAARVHDARERGERLWTHAGSRDPVKATQRRSR